MTKVKVDDKGNMQIDLYELFENIDEETLNNIATAYQWHQPAYTELIKSLRTEFTAPNFNPNLYKILCSFFAMPLEDAHYIPIIKQMKDVMKNIIQVNAELHTELYRASKARVAMYEYARDHFGDEGAYKINSVYLDTYYHDDNKYSHEIAKDMVKEVDFKELVEKWADEMNTLLKVDKLKGE